MLTKENAYGGVKPGVCRMVYIKVRSVRVLKPTGTFVLNIKEKAENGERHTCNTVNFSFKKTRMAMD
jgi:hypothetical protein